jgi:Xaa-His dipeptidase
MNDGIELYESDGFIRARGTTLGADNGVAVAIMLYILDGALESHPTLECLFTASEEKGLVGAGAFDYAVVSATKMINMDSADESEIIVGCAGGQRSELIFKPTVEKNVAQCLKISLKGLFGGHSGEDISKGRANANKLMGRVLNEIRKKYDIRLVSLYGGSKEQIYGYFLGVTLANEVDAIKRSGKRRAVIGGKSQLKRALSDLLSDCTDVEAVCVPDLDVDNSVPMGQITVFEY